MGTSNFKRSIKVDKHILFQSCPERQNLLKAVARTARSWVVIGRDRREGPSLLLGHFVTVTMIETTQALHAI